MAQLDLGVTPQIQAGGSIQSQALNITPAVNPIQNALTDASYANPYSNYLNILKEQEALEKAQIANDRQAQLNKALLGLSAEDQQLVALPAEVGANVQKQREFIQQQKLLQNFQNTLLDPNATSAQILAAALRTGNATLADTQQAKDATVAAAARETKSQVSVLAALTSRNPEAIKSAIENSDATPEQKAKLLKDATDNPAGLIASITSEIQKIPGGSTVLTNVYSSLEKREKLSQETAITEQKQIEAFKPAFQNEIRNLQGMIASGKPTDNFFAKLKQNAPAALQSSIENLQNNLRGKSKEEQKKLLEIAQPEITMEVGKIQSDIALKRSQAAAAAASANLTTQQAKIEKFFAEGITNGTIPSAVSKEQFFANSRNLTEGATKAGQATLPITNQIYSNIGFANSEQRSGAIEKFVTKGNGATDVVLLQMLKQAQVSNPNTQFDKNIVDVASQIATGVQVTHAQRRELFDALQKNSDTTYNNNKAILLSGLQEESKFYKTNSLESQARLLGMPELVALSKGDVAKNTQSGLYEVAKDNQIFSFRTPKEAEDFKAGKTAAPVEKTNNQTGKFTLEGNIVTLPDGRKLSFPDAQRAQAFTNDTSK